MVYKEVAADSLFESADLPYRLPYFGCTCSQKATLLWDGKKVYCKKCERFYFFDKERILHLLDNEQLDEDAQRELKEHTYKRSADEIAKWVLTERANLWKDYYTLDRQQGIKKLAEYLSPHVEECICFLGVGTGREIEYLLQYIPLEKVICSDISGSNLEVVMPRLATYPVSVEWVLTSDLNYCPVTAHEVPIVVVNALHHTGDMHEAIRRLLHYGYQNIFIFEPAGNWLISFFERRGLARRVEYSGVRPGRLDISRLRLMCASYGYQLNLQTMWSFPQDYFMRMGVESMMITRAFIGIVRTFSIITAPFEFGNSVIAHMQLDKSLGNRSPL